MALLTATKFHRMAMFRRVLRSRISKGTWCLVVLTRWTSTTLLAVMTCSRWPTFSCHSWTTTSSLWSTQNSNICSIAMIPAMSKVFLRNWESTNSQMISKRWRQVLKLKTRYYKKLSNLPRLFKSSNSKKNQITNYLVHISIWSRQSLERKSCFIRLSKNVIKDFSNQAANRVKTRQAKRSRFLTHSSNLVGKFSRRLGFRSYSISPIYSQSELLYIYWRMRLRKT